MTVTEYELIYGISTLIFIIVSVFIGIKITLKYRANQNIVFISVGMTWILLTTSWWGSATSFIFAVFDINLSNFWYLFLSNFFVPFALIFWFYSYLNLLYRGKIRIMYYIIVILAIYELLFLGLLMINAQYIGQISGVAYWRGSLFTIIFQVIALLSATITGIHFGFNIRKTGGNTNKIRGLFIIYAFASFLVLGLLDAVVELDAVSLVVVRILYVVCGITYYFGFFFQKKTE